MRLPGRLSWLQGLTFCITTLIATTSAVKILESSFLEVCQDNSGLTTTLFQVAYTANNRSIAFKVNGVSTISGNVTAEILVNAYGYTAVHLSLNGCDLSTVLCPMRPEPINIDSNYGPISEEYVGQIPGIAYSIPDLDGVVVVKIYNADTGEQVACVQTPLSNGNTVYQKGVGWATACVAGLALLVSAIISGLGFSNAASHVAATAMALFSFFQAQAYVGLTAVPLPPIVSAWTQNFQWSMGIIHIGFIQSICSWYQQATGGTPSAILASLPVNSVIVQKRAIAAFGKFVKRVARSDILYNGLQRRADTGVTTSKVVTVRGIDRVGFRANIEPTNIFLTGYIFFIVFIVLILIIFFLGLWILKAFTRSGRNKNDHFRDFRTGWRIILRGILLRMAFIGFPQMVALCFWELYVRDSAGEVTIAAYTIFTLIVILFYAAFKVWTIAARSIANHKNPAYILYSDPRVLHKWGFIFVQFKAAAYWFILPLLCYILAKGMFVGLGQGSGITQAIALVVLEAGMLLAVIILRPYMDKTTNGFNISIAVVNLVSAIFLLFFTDVFGLPGLVVGVMGVVYFIMNAALTLILIILVLISTIFVMFKKNPDSRYQPMRDDRSSFIKSQTQLQSNTELEALGVAARGEMKTVYRSHDDEDSVSNLSGDEQPRRLGGYAPLSQPYGQSGQNMSSRTVSTMNDMRSMERGEREPYDLVNNASVPNMREVPNRGATISPWQRGAGYDR